MRSSSKDFQINYEVLRHVWNDPNAKIRSQIMGEIFLGSMVESEIVIREDDLRAAGFIGRLPSCVIRYKGFSCLCWSKFYDEYLIRHKLIDENGLCLYSIFKWKER
jgi:hypothetical protein